VKLARNRSNAAHDKMTKNLILDRLDAELTEAEIRRKASLVELIDFLDKMNLDHSEVIDLMNPHIN
jgi:hypothetical protein